jgi:hypothetical protein
MPDPADAEPHPGSPELAELVQRTLAAKRAEPRSGPVAPGPSWAVSFRFRVGGFLPRSLSRH